MDNAKQIDGAAYQTRIEEIARTGIDMHGEAKLVSSYHPGSVLDAGCGTGRVAIELARNGVDVTGVDVNPSMINEARRLAPDLTWIRSDLATLALGQTFDVVLLAGNVPLFCPEESRTALIRNCARHVSPAGKMIVGFQLNRGFRLEDLDAALEDTGLVLLDRWSTWDRDVFDDQSEYVVSVHSR